MSRAIGEVLKQARKQGIDNLDAQVLLSKILSKDRSYFIAWPEKELNDKQFEQWSAWLSRRLTGEPIAHIVGEREFWSLPIKTTHSTLIPRPDTEVLVETVLSFYQNSEYQKPFICLDLGTGTGAIALALKSEKPDWIIIAVDRVEAAAELAKLNSMSLSLDIDVRVGNWCQGISEKADLIVSNPPYIDEEDEHLDQGDVRFEPKSALVAADNGLADISLISVQAMDQLKPSGGLFFEHGWRQSSEVKNILAINGFERISTVKDYADNDRVTFGFKPDF